MAVPNCWRPWYAASDILIRHSEVVKNPSRWIEEGNRTWERFAGWESAATDDDIDLHPILTAIGDSIWQGEQTAHPDGKITWRGVRYRIGPDNIVQYQNEDGTWVNNRYGVKATAIGVSGKSGE